MQKQSTASISGQVIDPLGIPIEKVSVKVLSGGKKLIEVFTDAQGSYEAMGLPKGEVIIVVEASEFRQLKKQIELREGRQILDFELDIGLVSLPPDLELNGFVHQSGNKPLHNATVSVIDPFTKKLIAETRTNESGEYNIHVYRVGQYVLYASKPRFMASASTILLQRNESIDFILSPLDQ
ncbi:MAG: carboxypeptidase-like regulatory domain-containing protein [Nitrososphaera sp.]|nr:carboxypeptidase-like regulatory domain-containing protein [Nitrososphaera sp.]